MSNKSWESISYLTRLADSIVYSFASARYGDLKADENFSRAVGEVKAKLAFILEQAVLAWDSHYFAGGSKTICGKCGRKKEHIVHLREGECTADRFNEMRFQLQGTAVTYEWILNHKAADAQQEGEE